MYTWKNGLHFTIKCFNKQSTCVQLIGVRPKLCYMITVCEGMNDSGCGYWGGSDGSFELFRTVLWT